MFLGYARRNRLEFDARELEFLEIPDDDGLVLGGLERWQGLEASPVVAGWDFLAMEPEELLGAAAGMLQLSFVGVIVMHLTTIPLPDTALATRVGAIQRYVRMCDGDHGKLLVAGAQIVGDEVPDGLKVSCLPARVRDPDGWKEKNVFEFTFSPDVTSMSE
ncbi:hypothetical protein ACG83_21940 [Frankia sp. R43]|uniref:hypothetical protein n=1 Tax=Frankia sp. R43 TaxID=269536 RepID=UPI0006CA3073|nr:hypothetical protein [Frankia sp. R43]KPM53385.1 hypothetical protein ACG83_21940 [Frankia sp. R43]